MAIITMSRKIASLGDETSSQLANILGYKFIERRYLEQCLIDMMKKDLVFGLLFQGIEMNILIFCVRWFMKLQIRKTVSL